MQDNSPVLSPVEMRTRIAQHVAPRRRVAILSCVDATVDPIYVTGLEPGDAIVYRTPGGLTPDVDTLTTMNVALHLFGVQHFLVIHHTPCLFAAPNLLPDELAYNFSYLINDPAVALQTTVRNVEKRVSPKATVSGHYWNELSNTISPGILPGVFRL